MIHSIYRFGRWGNASLWETELLTEVYPEVPSETKGAEGQCRTMIGPDMSLHRTFCGEVLDNSSTKESAQDAPD